MNIFVFAYILNFVQAYIEDTQTRLNTLKVHEFLYSNRNQLIQGQWSHQQDHLIHVVISQNNGDLLLQVTPKQNNLFNAKHDYKLLYLLDEQSLVFTNTTQELYFSEIHVNISLGSNLRGYKNYSCISNLSISIVGNIDSQFQEFSIIVQSSFDNQCKITDSGIKRFTFSDSKLQLETKVFALIITCTSIIQIISTIIVLRQQYNSQISSITLSIILLQDVYMCLFSALLFDLYTQWIYYFLPCIICQLGTILLDLQLKIQNQDYYNNQNNLQIISKSVLRGIIVFIIVSYLFYHIRSSQYLISLNLYLLPQIIETYWKGKRTQFNRTYIFGVCMPRSFIALYLRGSQLNWLQLKVKYQKCFYIIVLLIAQILIHYLQCKYGIFLRKLKGFNYFKKPEEENKEQECAICLTNLDKISEITNQNQKSNNYFDIHSRVVVEEASNNRLLMVTPCKHSFHTLCLSTWMELKSECPLCKQALPQIL